MARQSNYETCTLWFCNERHYGRGLCARHYQNWLRSGSPLSIHDDDLRVVLRVVDQYRFAVERLINAGTAIHHQEDGTYQCCYCGGVAGTREDLTMHKASCPVLEGLLLTRDTQSSPPEGDKSYELR